MHVAVNHFFVSFDDLSTGTLMLIEFRGRHADTVLLVSLLNQICIQWTLKSWNTWSSHKKSIIPVLFLWYKFWVNIFLMVTNACVLSSLIFCSNPEGQSIQEGPTRTYIVMHWKHSFTILSTEAVKKKKNLKKQMILKLFLQIYQNIP